MNEEQFKSPRDFKRGDILKIDEELEEIVEANKKGYVIGFAARMIRKGETITFKPGQNTEDIITEYSSDGRKPI